MKNKETVNNATVEKPELVVRKNAESGKIIRTAIQTPKQYNDELKHTMEEKRDSVMITVNELKKLGYADFAKWLRNIAKYNNTEKTMLIFKDRTQNRVFVVFFTAENKYQISAVKKENGDSYMGCILIGRKPRPGEDWDRGSDLPDGKYTKKTWDAIVNRIIAMEMKNLQCWR